MFEGLTFTCIVLLLYFSKFNLQINIAYPYMVHLLHQLDFIVSKFGSVQSSGLNKQVPFFFLFFLVVYILILLEQLLYPYSIINVVCLFI